MIKFDYTPEEDGFTDSYIPVSMEFKLANDANIDEHFDIFKKYMYALSFDFIQEYELVETEIGISNKRLIQELQAENIMLKSKLNGILASRFILDNPRPPEIEEDELNDYEEDIDEYDESDFITDEDIDEDIDEDSIEEHKDYEMIED